MGHRNPVSFGFYYILLCVGANSFYPYILGFSLFDIIFHKTVNRKEHCAICNQLAYGLAFQHEMQGIVPLYPWPICVAVYTDPVTICT